MAASGEPISEMSFIVVPRYTNANVTGCSARREQRTMNRQVAKIPGSLSQYKPLLTVCSKTATVHCSHADGGHREVSL